MDDYDYDYDEKDRVEAKYRDLLETESMKGDIARIEMSKQIQQRDGQRHLDALADIGMTPQEYQAHLAANPAAFQRIKEQAIYGATRELAQRFRNQAKGDTSHARDAQGRFTSGPPKGASKPKKTAAEYRARVAEKGKISGDSAEAVDVLEALLRG
ncbi:MAG: hypothetical protein ISR61_03525 [Desulfobacteraceae bacterium]|uniref:Scaffolding protein n=1 Tax=Candidatus Desulfacyla euxinica TaxID=2841693 RepID=A0A8J6T4A0_9DELT|nr:hypothetical protein [Candidatus Desulfacyla euxinica]MBL6977993.1 hypothetical protein [Desulfobacteraceae bacterium]